MSAGFRDFHREIRLATAGLEPEVVRRQLAAFARRELAEAIGRGEASPLYDTYVNGRKGASEDSVEVPGPIVYDFVWWPQIVAFALNALGERAPVRSGAYRDSFFVLHEGRRVTDYATIPRDGGIYVVSDRPYSRKIEVGHMTMRVPDGVVERAHLAVRRKFGGLVHVSMRWITLPDGYVLKGRFRRGVKKGARRRLREDTKAGARMTYPAIYMDVGED